MFGLYVHRDEGLTFIQAYPTPLEAHAARLEYVAAAKRNGFRARRGLKVTFLRHRTGVRLEVWVDRVNAGLTA